MIKEQIDEFYKEFIKEQVVENKNSTLKLSNDTRVQLK